MNTRETYVSLETAKLLKQAGFDWETEFGQHILDRDIRLEHNINFNSEKYLVSLPTLEIAQKWLREVKDIWCEVTICFVMEDALMKTKYHVQCISTDYNNPEMIDCYNIETDTPEEALEAGIKKALELILEKGE